MTLGLFHRNRPCLLLNSRKQIIQSTFIPVIEYGEIICMNAAATVLKPLDTVCHSALCFITSDRFGKHHCNLYQSVTLPSNEVSMHCSLFAYKVLLHNIFNLQTYKLPDPDSDTATPEAVETGEGRAAHNNGWNGGNGMASNTWKPCI
jgi:hypothetical protein